MFKQHKINIETYKKDERPKTQLKSGNSQLKSGNLQLLSKYNH